MTLPHFGCITELHSFSLECNKIKAVKLSTPIKEAVSLMVQFHAHRFAVLSNDYGEICSFLLKQTNHLIPATLTSILFCFLFFLSSWINYRTHPLQRHFQRGDTIRHFFLGGISRVFPGVSNQFGQVNWGPQSQHPSCCFLRSH